MSMDRQTVRVEPEPEEHHGLVVDGSKTMASIVEPSLREEHHLTQTLNAEQISQRASIKTVIFICFLCATVFFLLSLKGCGGCTPD